MSFEAVNWAMDQIRNTEDLTSPTSYVLLILANRADPEGLCWPSVKYIMRHTKLSERTVREACKEIATRGLMAVEPQRRLDGGKGSNRYILRLGTPPPAAGAPTLPAPNAGGQVHHAQEVGAGGAGHKTENIDSFSLTGERPAAKATVHDANGTAVAYIPIVNGGQFGISKEYVKILEEAYPAVDIMQTLKEIRAWAASNPKDCWTKNGVTRGINRWCEKEQNKPQPMRR